MIACGPKSDEHDDQIAPICAQARKASTVSGMLGSTAATLSSGINIFAFHII